MTGSTPRNPMRALILSEHSGLQDRHQGDAVRRFRVHRIYAMYTAWNSMAGGPDVSQMRPSKRWQEGRSR